MYKAKSVKFLLQDIILSKIISCAVDYDHHSTKIDIGNFTLGSPAIHDKTNEDAEN